MFSKFLNDFKDKDWRIHYSYTTNPSPQYDICWAKLDDDQPDALDLEHSVICDPTKVRVIFRQPYDVDAVWTLRGSEMGLTEAVLYRSPKLVVTAGDGNVPEPEYCSLLESMDVGFRGMGGAIALDGNDKCVGMFVKRGNLVPLKQPRTASTESVAAVVSVDIARESAIIVTLPLSPSSWLEQMIFPSISANMARMDANMARLDANMATLSVDAVRGCFNGTRFPRFTNMPTHLSFPSSAIAPPIPRNPTSMDSSKEQYSGSGTLPSPAVTTNFGLL